MLLLWREENANAVFTIIPFSVWAAAPVGSASTSNDYVNNESDAVFLR